MGALISYNIIPCEGGLGIVHFSFVIQFIDALSHCPPPNLFSRMWDSMAHAVGQI